MDNKKLANRFWKFSYIGAIWTAANIVFMWLLIDKMEMSGWMGSGIVVAANLIGRYYHYVYAGLFERGFLKFISTNIVFSILTVAFMSLFIDVLGFSAMIASPIVVGGMFIGKFFTFEKIGMMK